MKDQKPWYKDKAYQGAIAGIIVVGGALTGADFGQSEAATLSSQVLAGVAAVYTIFGRMFDRKKERQ